jgi:hypothetical protein
VRNDGFRLGCAALIGASIAFPLGLALGGGEKAADRSPAVGTPDQADGAGAGARNAYSPRIVSDPYVIEQQRRVLRSLELSCRELGRHCAEAGQARLRIDEAEEAR